MAERESTGRKVKGGVVRFQQTGSMRMLMEQTLMWAHIFTSAQDVAAAKGLKTLKRIQAKLALMFVCATF